ncbi:MAG: DUF2892 domain-containing protein [Myxococcota bacterium]
MSALDALVPKNEHTFDRALRVLGGAGMVAFAALYDAPWAYAGLIFVVTGLAGRCPIYRLFGIKTCTDCG